MIYIIPSGQAENYYIYYVRIWRKGGADIMQKKTNREVNNKPRWMTQCDVIRYNLKIPEDMKKKLKNEARHMRMDISSYICGVLSGDIKRAKD